MSWVISTTRIEYGITEEVYLQETTREGIGGGIYVVWTNNIDEALTFPTIDKALNYDRERIRKSFGRLDDEYTNVYYTRSIQLIELVKRYDAEISID